MLKKLSILVLVGAAGFVGLALTNFLPGEAPKTGPVLLRTSDLLSQKVSFTMVNKCLNCHASNQTVFPLYYQLPGVKKLIQQDIQAGTSALDIPRQIFDLHHSLSPVVLNQLEQVVKQGSMPPLKYIAMHWNSGLNAAEKADMLAWIEQERGKALGHIKISDPVARRNGVQPLPSVPSLDEAKIALGRQLFHEKRLSGDNTLSCANCHSLQTGGVDGRKTAQGIRGAIGPINVPTVYNAGLNFLQFWDGRAENLQKQAGGPVTNPIEMGGAWETVLPKLKQDPAYVQAFQKLYPNGITSDNVTDAIATFEETLLTPNARFDQYLAGNAQALNAEEKEGFHLFQSVGCATCHTGPNLGGLSFEKMGKRSDYFAQRGGSLTPADLGRFNVTHLEADRSKFKVPTLRNIALTAPYFHDGSVTDLRQAVRVMGRVQLGKNLSDREVDLLVKYLYTLNGETQGAAAH